MSDTSIEQKLEALATAGKNVPKKATNEEIEMLYMELEIEQEDADQTDTTAEPEQPAEIVTPSDSYDDVIAAADPKMGDKDPVVIDWCRKNLSPDKFEAKYAGRI